MFKAIFSLSALLVSTLGSMAEACPNSTLTCDLQVVDFKGSWTLVSKATSIYTSKPLHCMARVNIPSAVNSNLIYFAAASTDGNTILFMTEGGVANTSLSAIGVSTEAPVVLNNASEKLSCSFIE